MDGLKKILVLILLVPFMFCATKDKEYKYIIKGKYVGSPVPYLNFTYPDSLNNIIYDSIPIINNQFYAEGKLNGPIRVSLATKGDTTMSEDGSTFFFLEPGEISIELHENQFQDAVILGSKTQDQYNDLERLVAPIYSEITPLMLERNGLLEELRNNQDHVRSIEDRISLLTDQWSKKLDSIRTLRLQFVSQNPASHLSAYWVGAYYFNEIPLDSAINYYDNFTSEVKSGKFGKDLKLKIDKSKTSTARGDKAPNFELTDLKGNRLSLGQFSGKYVLLDFWASWCKPCREHNLDLIRFHEMFHSKGLEIIGLTSDGQRDKWEKAIVDDGIGIWHHAFPGKDKIAINTEYKITAIPAYILIDREGYIIDRYLAADDKKLGLDDLEKRLKELMGQ